MPARSGATSRNSVVPDRAERLRRGRAVAIPLRETSATIARLAVRLKFASGELVSHAEQLFILYPSAKGYFGFPCPYGDCDGIYDLSCAAASILRGPATEANGTLDCTGARTLNRVPSQRCNLRLRFTLSAERKGAIDE